MPLFYATLTLRASAMPMLLPAVSLSLILRFTLSSLSTTPLPLMLMLMLPRRYACCHADATPRFTFASAAHDGFIAAIAHADDGVAARQGAPLMMPRYAA